MFDMDREPDWTRTGQVLATILVSALVAYNAVKVYRLYRFIWRDDGSRDQDLDVPVGMRVGSELD